MKFIPYGRQTLDRSDLSAVIRTLRSDWWTQGPEVGRFEEAFAAYCGAPYAVAVSSGTSALHLAALAAEFGPGDEVATTPLTFAATVNCLLYAGAAPRLADVRDDTLGLDAAAVRRIAGPKMRGAIPVHYAGQPCGFDAREAFGPRPVKIIEDACHALGAEESIGGKWSRIGACRRSDMAVFSFHPVKTIATGEGGMITTKNKQLYERLCRLRSHGIERDPARFRAGPADEPWRYEVQELGYNYRMTDIQASLGLSQLKRLGQFLSKRRAIAAVYDRAFAAHDHIRVPARIAGTRPAYHLYALRIDFDDAGLRRAEVMRRLRKLGVGTQVHYVPIPHHPYYQKRFGWKPAAQPVSEKFYSQALSIPMHCAMSLADAKRVAKAVVAVVSGKK